MLDKTDDISVAADTWLAQFEEALTRPDEGLLKTQLLIEDAGAGKIGDAEGDVRDPSEVRWLYLRGSRRGKQAKQDRQQAGSKIRHRILDRPHLGALLKAPKPEPDHGWPCCHQVALPSRQIVT